jgi:HSP20 family protein
MAVALYDPFSEFKKSIDLFNNIINTPKNGGKGFDTDFLPTVNSREDDKAYYLEVDLPGVKKEDISLTVENGVLTVCGERKSKEEVKEENYYKVESNYGKFSRSFSLPKTIDDNKIEAKTQDGVLELTIPKREEEIQKTKKISIQ